MAVSNFRPDIWSKYLLGALSATLVGRGCCNADYSGDATGGSVKITSIADPTIGDYTEHTDITIEDIDDATRSLLLDQKKYFGFELDDVEAAQAANAGGLMAEAVARAAYGLARAIDVYALSTMAAGASAAAPDHQVAESTISTATAAYDALVDWGVLLDQANIPEQGRFAVVTPAFHGKLLKDSRFIAAGDAAGAVARANGRVGEAAGFQILKSNNLPDGPGAGAGKSMIAGYTGATTLAVQVNKIEALRLEKRFADAVKGLTVYGAKVTRPTGLVVADVIVS
jgi:hypothetical protein